MQRYGSADHDSGVVAYELGADAIAIQFQDGSIYLYNAALPGQGDVTAMRRLAVEGKGLATYINQHVRDRYAARLR